LLKSISRIRVIINQRATGILPQRPQSD